MPSPSAIAAGLCQFSPDQLRAMLRNFLPRGATTAQKVSAIETALASPAGQSLREAMARWIVDEIVPVERLVPESYFKWRQPVGHAMKFVVARLSAARLAPKLLEQIELPSKTSAETRLLLLIAKVPGLQKLGQVIARNQHLRPALRNALARLENGIRDVKPADIQAIIQKELGPRLKTYDVKVAPVILKEASVSAVVRFTWFDRDSGKRQRAVFKVLKPHIPEFFAEDMDYLEGLAGYFADQHHTYGFPAHLIPDTFEKVRRLLKHEVNFAREQKTLMEAGKLYQGFPGVRVPHLIRVLSTRNITAITAESGIKVTDAAARLPVSGRRKVAEQLVEALVAVPLFARTEDAVFHGDPHAGNLLYDNRTRVLTILDWALRERLGRQQRRHLALLFLMVTLRDPVGISNEIGALSQPAIGMSSPLRRMVRALVDQFLKELPATRLPSGAEAMRLLERVAIQGVKFPASLIMLSKVMFTLEGILGDMLGPDTGMGFTLARHVAQHWLANRSAFRSPLIGRDWLALECSALLYTSRLWVQWEQSMLDRYLPPKPVRAAS
jgi:ubiquinone biosynthesis protein